MSLTLSHQHSLVILVTWVCDLESWYTWYQDVKGDDTLLFADRRCRHQNGDDKGGRRSSFNSLGGKVGV